MNAPARPTLFSRAIGSIHCVGIGGMGLGPLAIYLSNLGFAVTGEDDAFSEAMREQLAQSGIAIMPSGELPAHCDLLVYSSAIPIDHPAVVMAQRRAIPQVRRGELLAEVTKTKRLVAICGSHGKTTTTAMLVTALLRSEFSPGYVLGGLFNDSAIPPAAVGSTDWVVAEIDESDGTIAWFSPEITVAVNLDWDHPDFYRSVEELEETFAGLFKRTTQQVLISDDCVLSARVAQKMGGARFLTFGKNGNFRATVSDEFQERTTLVLGGDFPISSATVRAQGDFNASNAVAALAAAHLMGAKLTPELLADYGAVRRRQTVLKSPKGIRVIEDYAHHPAEIKAFLRSQRKFCQGRLMVVFQPHRFSRTAQFLRDFATALSLADRVYLLDVYSAGELPVEGGTTADLFSEFARSAPLAQVAYHPENASLALSELTANVRPGDLVAFIGAGDVDGVAREWLGGLGSPKTDARWTELATALRLKISDQSKVRCEEPLAEKTTLRIGGRARCYAEPASEGDLTAILLAAVARQVPVHFLGRGSNLLIPDEGVDGLVISLAHSHWQVFEKRPDGRIWVGAGLRLKNLCGLAAKEGLAGFEFLEGIPGNIGGALRMNAGAMGGWIFDIVEEILTMGFDGGLRRLKKAELHVGYRHCVELENAIALGALLAPVHFSAATEVARQIDVYRDKRQKTQPREPSAGCVFKNPSGDSAGRIIDDLGLKGERVGDAEISTVHANFIINRGHATCAEVVELMRRVRSRAESAKGIKLEPEILLYGKEWKDVL